MKILEMNENDFITSLMFVTQRFVGMNGFEFNGHEIRLKIKTIE